jgi:hypothetical protein
MDQTAHGTRRHHTQCVPGHWPSKEHSAPSLQSRYMGGPAIVHLSRKWNWKVMTRTIHPVEPPATLQPLSTLCLPPHSPIIPFDWQRTPLQSARCPWPVAKMVRNEPRTGPACWQPVTSGTMQTHCRHCVNSVQSAPRALLPGCASRDGAKLAPGCARALPPLFVAHLAHTRHRSKVARTS